MNAPISNRPTRPAVVQASSFVRFVQPWWGGAGWAVINLSVDKIDRDWQRDRDGYIGPEGGCLIDSQSKKGHVLRKYQKNWEFVRSIRGPLIMSAIRRCTTDESDDSDYFGLVFIDGRNRFAVLRDLGATHCDFMCPSQDDGYLTERYS